MRMGIYLAPVVRWAAASILLSAAAAHVAGDTTTKTGSDVEMSTISGEPANPRRHFRLRDPQPLDPDRAEEIYAIVRKSMAAGYPLSGLAVARDYQGWRRYNSTPYLSVTHGNHFLNNYANGIASAYGEYEGAGRLPVGAVIAKDSFAVVDSGGILLGPLFIMEKMPQGFSYVSGDWKFTLVKPDGTVFGETNGPGAGRVEYCIACHLARERFDHLYFIPKDFRR
jgi:hypothetical protein